MPKHVRLESPDDEVTHGSRRAFRVHLSSGFLTVVDIAFASLSSVVQRQPQVSDQSCFALTFSPEFRILADHLQAPEASEGSRRRNACKKRRRL